MKIGFIGLGIMGRPMAKNLLKAGYDVTVDSHFPAAAAELEACGAKVADQPTIGSTCDLVLTMLPNAPQVKQVMLGANGVAAHMQPGSTFIDMTSLNPIASKEIAAELASHGIQMLDAPVSGGEPKAIDGTMSIMVGGDQKDFEDAFGITRSTASKVCSLMETKGLIHRQPVSDDARLKKITLTDRGETMRREMIEGRKRMEAKLTAGFSSEELQNLRDYLRRMKENMKR